MAASRKLQGEIDRCLKKVAEGVEQFDDIWKKVHNATNSNQKEKYEADLKKEIKKLQRLRDQIKTWLASGEIKDKTSLMDNRKLIETQMERFKVVERETKTKAYSKEGLGAAQNKDPVQREREDTTRWLSESIDTLNIQVDQFESEIESLMAIGKKKKIDKDKSERIDNLKEWLDRHRFHIKKLEILMRMLNNESIDCDKIKKIKDDVECYIESSQDPCFIENDGLYDEIDLEDMDYPTPDLAGGKLDNDGSPLDPSSEVRPTDSVLLPLSSVCQESTDGSTPSSSVCGSSPAPSPAAPNNHSSDHDGIHHDRKRSSNKDDSRISSTPVKPQVVRPNNSTNNNTCNSSSSNTLANSTLTKGTPPPSTPTKPVSGSTSQSTPNNSSTSSGLTNHLIISPHQHNNLGTHSPESSLSSSVIGHNSASNSLMNSLSNHHSHSNIPNHLPISATNGPISNSNPSSTNTIITSIGGGTVPGLLPSNNGTLTSLAEIKSSSATPTSTTSQLSNLQQTLNCSDSTSSLKVIAQKKLSEVTSSLPLSASQEVSHSLLGSSTNTTTTSPPTTTLSTSSALLSNSNPANKVTTTTNSVHLPPLLGVAPLGPVPLTVENDIQYKRTQMAFYRMPHPSDSERLRIHFPRQPCTTPSYYPQMPLPLSDTVDFFQRLSTETLFFIFYYMEGTKAQYLAAKALKKQSWRFHTKYMMWFQRHEEPKTITDEYEQGTYIFFDFENWGQRKRENFVFEYRYLEDRDLN